jgi:hypothetical protein
MTKHVARVAYSPEQRQIELTVPHGTTAQQLSDIIVIVVNGGLGGTGRPCNTCTSGDHWLIREELADTVEVNLDSMRKSP